jgi:hypothetical protein
VITDHGLFVLVNAYLPACSNVIEQNRCAQFKVRDWRVTSIGVLFPALRLMFLLVNAYLPACSNVIEQNRRAQFKVGGC